MMSNDAAIQILKFSDININDPFFDTLKQSYAEFVQWFLKKADEPAYVVYDTSGYLQAFLYIKLENGPVLDIEPPLNIPLCLKVGTFKVNSHGTKLGERFVKIILDAVLESNIRHAYVTVFPQHEPLIHILEDYGFKKYGIKRSSNGIEDVYVKDMNYISGNTLLDYPVIDARMKQKWLLAIYPQYHTPLFPDSKLKTVPSSLIQDVSHTNSIHKVYVGFLREMPLMRPGDCLVIYCCLAPGSNQSAWFKSVATSICVAEEVRPKRTFASESDFVSYCQRYSVFSRAELQHAYNLQKGNALCSIKMTYNLALPKRPNLSTLVVSGAVPPPGSGHYFGLMRLSDQQFSKILELGQANAGFVIN